MKTLTTLDEILRCLDEFDPEFTIFAATPWTSSSRAILLMQPDPKQVPDEAKLLGLKYLAEVFVAQEFLADWESLLTSKPTDQERCDRFISYAINDA